jgi:peptidyl-prolyl cis-trans isomerase C
MRSWLRSPIVAFLAIGVLLFGLQALLAGRDSGAANRSIDVTATEIQWLSARWAAQWNRLPTERELQGLVDDYVRQEVLYREALALGLGREDEVIKRRLVQKLELLTENLATQVQPTDAQLQTYLEENADRYRFPERRSFQHVYVDLDRRGEAALGEVERILATLTSSPGSETRSADLGDPFMLAHAYGLQTPAEVSRLFGSDFSERLFELAVGEWQGPVLSGYGLHVVRVTDVAKGRMPELAEVMGYVLTDYQRDIRERARDEVFAGLLDRYDVEIDRESIRILSLDSGSPGSGE